MIIGICFFVYVMIGIMGYLEWGDSDKFITAVYWTLMWPHMMVWTYMANKEDFWIWARNYRVKYKWNKIKKYFKIDIKGEE